MGISSGSIHERSRAAGGPVDADFDKRKWEAVLRQRADYLACYAKVENLILI